MPDGATGGVSGGMAIDKDTVTGSEGGASRGTSEKEGHMMVHGTNCTIGETRDRSHVNRS
jgi:hypothetical protein